ncbi:MAG TPA: hypothetical protein VFN26_19860 [Candidatus Acidoferrum sp.]|nr:hypothetical protein [Candidatus Acidoferrum sp.]
MIDRNSKWDRQELYEKVWQFPLRKLAAEYSISDVGLAKICHKLKIPLPGLGHWTQIACGHTIPQPPLPEVENLPVLIRQVREPKTPILPEDAPKLEVIARVEASTTPTVTKATLAHPLMEKTRLALSEGRTTDHGKLWASREAEWLDLRVTKDCLARALRIMAVIIHILEEQGFRVVVAKKETESTSAIVYGENIRFGVVEKSRQIKSATTSGSYTYNRVRLEPTGMLSLEIWNYCPERLRRAWRDSERAKLEEHLPACIAGMMKIALAARSRRDAEEKKEQATQKRIDEVRAVLTQIEKEETKIKALRREAIAWHRAERIRKYVAAVHESAVRDAEWVAWAERQADRIDPLKPSPSSIVDDKPEVLRRLRSVERGW